MACDILEELPEGVLKEILEPGTGVERPRAGDEVQIAFKGFLPDGKEFHRSEDFHFKLGQGEVNKGLDLGLATMAKGEHARLTLSPEFAYGEEGVPGKIPPQATLSFEVTLAAWERKHELLAEGISKVTLRAGQGKRGHRSFAALLRYTARTEGTGDSGDSEFSSGEVELAPGQCLVALPSRSWELVLGSMRQKERAVFTLQPHAYGQSSAFDGKVPEGATVLLDLELLDLLVVEECGLFKDWAGEPNFPRVTKKQLEEGKGDAPAELAEVTARLDGQLVTWTLLEDSKRCEAVESAVLNLALGARCQVASEDENMWQDELQLGPHCTVELVAFQSAPDWRSSRAQRLDSGGRLKQRGAEMMKAKSFRRACWLYRRVQDYFGYIEDWPEEERCQAEALRQQSKSNEVMAWIKLEQFQYAVDLCTEILNGGGGSCADPGNLKALFRRALAWLGLGEAEKALRGFQEVLDKDPSNSEAKQQLTKARRLRKQQTEHSQGLMKGMISGAGSLQYPMGYTSAEGERDREREAMMEQIDKIKSSGPLVL